ncbi:HigA antitoxin [Pontimonas salivibrio]|uniref:HigA antitoxin n=1 Tax=Pontimonas salivibrio TaxID=1159327 RepID=A0A2L2BR77_9MICO|nr:transcriptional regulator [Pontimonas salivibrio]AVG24165.1 HigA antitoxin [Pontimonas salivibrio]
MFIHPIRNETDLHAALETIEALMDANPAPGTPESEQLDVLATLVEAYEAKHHPISPPDPVEAIRFRMEQSGLAVSDLAPLIGSTSRVYEVLNKKRPLSIRMIRNLHRELGIPAEALIA